MAQILWERTNALKASRLMFLLRKPTPSAIPETFGPATPTKQWYNSKESGRDAHDTWMARWNRVQNPRVGTSRCKFGIHGCCFFTVVGLAGFLWPFRGEPLAYNYQFQGFFIPALQFWSRGDLPVHKPRGLPPSKLKSFHVEELLVSALSFRTRSFPPQNARISGEKPRVGRCNLFFEMVPFLGDMSSFSGVIFWNLFFFQCVQATDETQWGRPPIAGGSQQHKEGNQQWETNSHRSCLPVNPVKNKMDSKNNNDTKKNGNILRPKVSIKFWRYPTFQVFRVFFQACYSCDQPQLLVKKPALTISFCVTKKR